MFTAPKLIVTSCLVLLLLAGVATQIKAVSASCHDADITKDGTVNADDVAPLVQQFFKKNFAPLAVDVTKDGSVDIRDYHVVVKFFSKKCAEVTPPAATPITEATPTSTPDTANLPAFPGAEGFGAKSKGGRGGKVILVSNTNDSGAGSLRNALEIEKGPRTVVFTTGGTISLSKPIKLQGEDASYVTVAGQTAPGDGIQIKNYGILLYHGVHDVVLRHLRIRVGQRSDYNYADDNDSIEIWGGTAPVYNIVIDHVSAQWALDENISVYDKVYDVTFQYNLIAESSTDGQDHKTAKGMLIGNDDPNKLPNNMSLHHNVFAHNNQRNPRVAFADTDMRNNVIYNWGQNNSSTFGNYQQHLQSLSQPTRVNIVNNLWKKGPSTHASQKNALWVNKGAELFVQGNWGMECPTGCGSDEWKIGVLEEFEPYAAGSASKYRKTTEFNFPDVSTQSTDTLMSEMLTKVGATLPKRDSVDARIILETISGTGDEGITGGYPNLSAGSAPADSDQDGIPNAWEQLKGLNGNDKQDSNAIAPSGYTWIEEYINSL